MNNCSSVFAPLFWPALLFFVGPVGAGLHNPSYNGTQRSAPAVRSVHLAAVLCHMGPMNQARHEPLRGAAPTGKPSSPFCQTLRQPASRPSSQEQGVKHRVREKRPTRESRPFSSKTAVEATAAQQRGGRQRFKSEAHFVRVDGRQKRVTKLQAKKLQLPQPEALQPVSLQDRGSEQHHLASLRPGQRVPARMVSESSDICRL